LSAWAKKRRESRRFVVIFLAISVSLAVLMATSAPVGAQASGRVQYRSPTNAPIVDHFRPPPHPWMAGNRGIDYGTIDGDEVHSSASGRVVFAGEVGGQLHVTIQHSDGLRTSYSFLASLTVSAGDRVVTGDTVGIAGGSFHFGVRTPDNSYLDPEAVLAGTEHPTVQLVPGTDDGLAALDAAERHTLLDTLLDTGTSALRVAAQWSTQTGSLVVHYAIETNPNIHVVRIAASFGGWLDQRDSCTPANVAITQTDQRRIAVLVSGLGTASGGNSAWEVDTAALGYAPSDVVRFSYAGGQSPSAGTGATFSVIQSREFDATTSQQSIDRSGDELQQLLTQVAAVEPGLPIDVIAHSQGGVVARLAIQRGAADGRLPDTVANLVTIGTPHQGAPLATGIAALHATAGGALVMAGFRYSGAADELDDRQVAFGDLAENSSVIAELHDRPMPDQVHFATIGAAGDVIVPGTAAIDDSADFSVILPSSIGKEAHGELPSLPVTTREIGLALAGQGPTCQSLGEAMGSAITAEGLRWLEADASAVLAVGAAMAGPVPGPR